MNKIRQYQERKYVRAVERVEKLKRFYKHLAVYVFVNLFFIFRRIYKDVEYGDTLIDALSNTYNYRLFFWWGIGLVFHAIGTFSIESLYSKDWEDRKIKEFMDREY